MPSSRPCSRSATSSNSCSRTSRPDGGGGGKDVARGAQGKGMGAGGGCSAHAACWRCVILCCDLTECRCMTHAVVHVHTDHVGYGPIVPSCPFYHLAATSTGPPQHTQQCAGGGQRNELAELVLEINNARLAPLGEVLLLWPENSHEAFSITHGLRGGKQSTSAT